MNAGKCDLKRDDSSAADALKTVEIILAQAAPGEGACRNAMQLLEGYRGQTVIIKMGGSLMDSAAAVGSLVCDASLLARLSVRVVIVHGGGAAISRELEARGVETRFESGYRVTSEEQAVVIDEVLSGITKQLADGIRSSGQKAQALRGPDVFACTPKLLPFPSGERGIGFVGSISSVRTAALSGCLSGGAVPVVSPTACGPGGKVYNCNADDAAAAAAAALQSRRLLFLTDVPGILRDMTDPASVISSISFKETGDLIGAGIIGPKLLPKLEGAFSALRSGIDKVSFIPGVVEHAALLGLLTPDGIGTIISA